MYNRYRRGELSRHTEYLPRHRGGRNRPRSAYSRRFSFNFGNRRRQCFFYGKPYIYRPRWDRFGTNEAKPEEKPQAPKEELAKILQVKNVDLKFKANALKHRTTEYSLTQDYDEEDGKHHDPECVIRRGDYMEMVIEFDRPYNKGKHDMKLCFEFDEDGDETFETRREMVLNEDKREKFDAEKWGANLIKCEGNKIEVEVHVASNCIIGDWMFSITTIVEGKDKDGNEVVKEFTYEDEKLNVTILFNPWCKEDDVYCPDSKMCDEYVLNADGYVCTGGRWSINNKTWIFGQFEKQVVDLCLELLKKRFKPRRYHLMANPAIVARIMANEINDNILYGRWDGEYDDGKKPWLWKSSAKILQTYMKTKSMVKYGQCWVFSGVLTAVCRALGIPCRSVTNFSSAHDTDESNTIDKYFTRDESGKLCEDKLRTSDSVWNFHVWNEIYMRRRDLDKTGHYDGWQAVDSTPQEASDGIYTCGPAPITAVREGNCRMDYDTGFVFSEVNADEVQWCHNGQKFEPFRILKGKIGRNISTKGMGTDEREDVTSHYKNKEGSEEERKAVEMAHLTARKPKKNAYCVEKIKKVKFNLLHSSDVMIGDKLDITVKATNNGRHARKISSVQLVIEAETYTGDKIDPPIIEKDLGSIQIASGKVENFTYTFDPKTYLPCLVEGCNIRILAMCSVEGLGDEEEEIEVKDHHFVFKKPTLNVEVPKKKVKKGETMKVELSFQNPLNEKLEVETLSEDTIAFDLVRSHGKEDEIKIGKKVDPKAWFKQEVKVVANKSTACGVMAFTIDCDKIFDITGSARVEVVE